MLVSHEDAVRIGQEVREDFQAALAESKRIGAELDAYARMKARSATERRRAERAARVQGRSWLARLFGR